MRLHSTPFTYIIPKDLNRAADGASLRRRFVTKMDTDMDLRYVARCLDDTCCRPCSILEMMIALAIRCEEDIMDDPKRGDRTKQWFWNMVVSLGLGAMTDERFDRDYVDMTLRRFLDREYEPNGKGGLFTIPGTKYDLRNVEIWYQLLWYLDTFV